MNAEHPPSDPTASKMKLPKKLAVIVCEIHDGGCYMPLLKLHQGPDGCVIESGKKMAARCLQILPAALDAVTQELASHDAQLERIGSIFREQFEAVLTTTDLPTTPDH